MTVYNEFDPFAAQWLGELIADQVITAGKVDTRSIKEVSGDDLSGFDRVHLFAGIGGWDYALQLAGWPATRPVWTGSCPCQPFSSAGKRKGKEDDRHLWPDMFRLIRECRPDTVFGEQVASAIGHGWLDGVFADLESEGYACGAVVLGAHSVGAPHIRQRLWWVAKSESPRPWPEGTLPEEQGRRGCELGREGARVDCRMGDASGERLPKRIGNGRFQSEAMGTYEGQAAVCGGDASVWSKSYWHQCRDGKARRVPAESALFPLADGLPNRVGLLRGAGNAIVPQVAAEFVKAFLDHEAMLTAPPSGEE